MEKLSNKPPSMEMRDSDEEFSDTNVYDEELKKVQTSDIYKIVLRPITLAITDVMQWIAAHVYFRCLVVVANDGRVLGLLTPNNFQNMYHLKTTKVKCNKEYLDNFYVVHPNQHMLMKPWY